MLGLVNWLDSIKFVSYFSSKTIFQFRFCTSIFVLLYFFPLPINCLLKFPLLFISALKLEPNWIVSLSQPRLILCCRINPSFICFGMIQQSLPSIKGSLYLKRSRWKSLPENKNISKPILYWNEWMTNLKVSFVYPLLRKVIFYLSFIAYPLIECLWIILFIQTSICESQEWLVLNNLGFLRCSLRQRQK